MFATTCSKPLVTKAAMHQAIAMIFEPSLVERVAHQIARHTRMLHRMPRVSISGTE